MNNIKSMHEQKIVNRSEAKMENMKLHALLLVLIISGAIFFLTLSLAVNFCIISNIGEITDKVMAKSGSAADIQAAVNMVASAGGGNVYIPAGTFNFVPVGGPWVTVNIPPGVNLIGAAPSGNDSNSGPWGSSQGIPASWATTLVMPYDVPGTWYDIADPNPLCWFELGNGTHNIPSRFANIKLQGYRSINPSSTTLHIGICILGVTDFRIDHCCFENCAGGAIHIGLCYQQNFYCSGVIDHCMLYNTHGWDDLANYMNGNIGYGVEVSRSYYSDSQGSPMPFEPMTTMLGHYNNRTVYIENCYFSKWRHCVTAGHGGYYVFRYNIIDQDFGHYSLDVHGLRDSESGRAGGQGCEIYENIFRNITSPDEHGGTSVHGVMQNGGGYGVFFNNYIDSSYYALVFYNEDYVPSLTWHVQNFYMWSSKGSWTPTVNFPIGAIPASRNVTQEWSRPAYNLTDPQYPNCDLSWTMIAGYKPYQYPHPLTLGQ
jgi:hypothetical protein